MGKLIRWKCMPYIIGNEMFERVALYAMMTNLMVYLVTRFGMQKISMVNSASVFVGNSLRLRAFISDAYWASSGPSLAVASHPSRITPKHYTILMPFELLCGWRLSLLILTTISNHLQLDAQISLQGKRRSPYKRINGFQFSPNDDRKLMVTCADSQIRILSGVDVICKYRGIRNAGSQISASFTSDGRHIVSASEDSYVYVWSHTDQYPPTSKKVKMKNSWSSEHFFSSYVSVAIPWHGSDSKNPVTVISDIPRLHSIEKSHADSLGSNTSGGFIPSRDFFSELLPKGSATWPEEKLPMSSITPTALGKSQCKFLKTSCQNTPHAWGQVVLTAGWDGRIRSFRNYGYPVHI